MQILLESVSNRNSVSGHSGPPDKKKIRQIGPGKVRNATNTRLSERDHRGLYVRMI